MELSNRAPRAAAAKKSSRNANPDFCISDDPYVEQALRTRLQRREYWFILAWIKYHLRTKMCSDETGNVFDNCLKWCGQGRGEIENAIPFVRIIFDALYFDLPPTVRSSLVPAAEAIGFNIELARIGQKPAVRSKVFFEKWIVRLRQPRVSKPDLVQIIRRSVGSLASKAEARKLRA